MHWNEDKEHIYWNPYFGGFMVGIILILVFYFTGRGLGASGAAKSTVVTMVHSISPEHAEHNAYYKKILGDDKKPMNDWLVFELLGILAGAFFSGSISGRVKFRVQHSPKITSRKRLIAAFLGGMFFGIGSQFARGCTSGAALSGMTVLSMGGFIAMIAIFGSGYMFAYFFRKLWI
jgi:uncharacterized membrane protein YedE/YeeE